MRLLLLIVYFFLLSVPLRAQDTTRSYARPTQTTPAAPAISERQISYPGRVLREELDFKLTPVSKGKFKLNVTTRSKAPLLVKIYDVIGNLLYEQEVRVRGSFELELDMSTHTTNFFIVEIGNEEFNKTKSIVAT